MSACAASTRRCGRSWEGAARAEGPADRLRHGHRGRDVARPAARARLRFSVLGSEKKRDALAGARGRARRPPGALARELRMKRTPQLTFEYDPTVERGVRMSKLIDELAPDDDDRELSSRRPPRRSAAGALPRHDAREPGRRRARLAARDDARARPARQGRVDVPRRRRAAAGRVRVHAARELRGSCRTTRASVLLALDCANEPRLGPDPEVLQQAPLVVDIDHHHDNTRFGDVNLIVATRRRPARSCATSSASSASS